MGKISLEEYRKLSQSEKEIQYQYLSDYDKYVVRITDVPKAFKIGKGKSTEEEKTDAIKRRNKLIKITSIPTGS